jgi:putative phosphoribosyl transferase
MSIRYGKSDYFLIKAIAKIQVSKATLLAEVNIPTPPKGIVIFPQIKNSSFPHSKLYNTFLNNRYGVVIVNLLKEKETEAEVGIDILTERLIEATQWLKSVFVYDNVNLAYYGDCHTAATVIKASTCRDYEIKAIVCKDSQADLISNDLGNSVTPTLLMVDELNREISSMTKTAMESLNSIEKLIVFKSSEAIPKPDFTQTELNESLDWMDKHMTPSEFVSV